MATSQPLGVTLQGFVTAGTALGVAFYYSWTLTLVILAGLPIAFACIGLLSMGVQKHIHRQARELSSASVTINRALSGIETVKSYNGQAHECNLYEDAIKMAGSSYRGQAHCNGMQIGIA